MEGRLRAGDTIYIVGGYGMLSPATIDRVEKDGTVIATLVDVQQTKWGVANQLAIDPEPLRVYIPLRNRV
jgi:hypothetical protein